MSQRNETFARLLKGAINSIAAYEGKTTPAIEDNLGVQIGVSGATIQRGYLGREWLQRFLYAARYPFAAKLLDQLQPVGPTRVRPSRVFHNLPAPTYSQFVMRQQPFDEVVDGLQHGSALYTGHALHTGHSYKDQYLSCTTHGLDSAGRLLYRI